MNDLKLADPALLIAHLDSLGPRSDWSPDGWSADAAVFRGRRGELVLLGVEIHGGKAWIHLSMSVACATPGKRRIPTYDELCDAKAAFIGDRKAVQVFAPKSEHFSIEEVLHLWACLGRDPLPDFRRFDPRIGVAGI